MSTQWTGYTLAAIGAALFAAKAVVVKLAYLPVAGSGATSPDPITLLGLRMAFSLPIYVAIGIWAVRSRARKALPLPTPVRVLKILIAGSLGYYLASYLDFSGLQYITAQLERLILFTYPIVVVVLGAVFLGVPITRWTALGIVFSYGGLLLVFLTGTSTIGVNLPLGAALVAAAAFAFALYQLAAKPLMEDIGSRLFTCLAMGGAATAVLLHFSIDAMLSEQALVERVSLRAIHLGLVLALLCTIVPSFMMTAAIKHIGPQSVAIVGTLSPIATVVLAVWLLGEPFGFSDAVGTALVMLGVGLYAVKERAQVGRSNLQKA